MTSYIALLRGVNVGGNRKLPMAELKASLTQLGYVNVRTLLASGNIVFDAPKTAAAKLEAKMEADLKSAAGVTTDVIIRDPKEWAAILAANPFPKDAETRPNRLLVMVMKTKADKTAAQAYLASYTGEEKIEFVGRDVFIVFTDGMADSRLALQKFGVGTARNWNTMQKLDAMVAA
jgi:uncharacterized protein (DUF1697 family)